MTSEAEFAQKIRCTRLQLDRTVEEHRACPYCFGRAKEIESGERPRFCDYDPSRDPIVFGFPDGTSRANG